MERTLCKELYVGKSETSFNIRPNNHRKDVKKPDGILTCKHFQDRNYVFKKHAKFIIKGELTNMYYQIKRLTKKTVALLLNVHLHKNCRSSHVTRKVKFCHNLFKNYLTSRSFCKQLLISNTPLKISASEASWENSLHISSNPYFYVILRKNKYRKNK